MKYNLPHVTSYDFVAYSHVPLVNVADLKKKGIPNNNFWSKYGNLTVDQLVDKLDKDLHILRDYNVATKGYTLDPRNRLAESPYDYKQEATAAPATNVNVSMLKSSGASTLIEQSKRRLAELVTGGYMPVVIEKASGKEDVIPVPPPPPENERTPKLFIVLHYKMTTFLGDYGAGEVVKTMSLLPGEKTTISIKNYTNTEETRKKAESVLDSYSQSSADEFQKMVDYASEYHSGMNRSESVASTNTFNAGVSGSISLGLIFGSMDFNASYGYTGTQSSSLNTTVQNQAKLMNNITNTHVAKADSNRKIEVNSEATSKITTGSEEVIIREIE
ncbi:MAG: hypothetical protein JNL32_09255, partial [Candidatus Kapabacteria bacterium]|nr:hypothetical protein [Candidatus Kapabacteria bacterium]